MKVRLGPDATRYVLAGRGETVARPFHLRWLLPALCRDRLRRWEGVWLACWPTVAVLMVLRARQLGLSWQASAAGAVMLVALPGVWGPQVVRPVGVDLPAMTLALGAVTMLGAGWWIPAVLLACVAASVKESSPVWAALWCWNPVLLVALVVPAVTHLVRSNAVDQVTAQPGLIEVYRHPVATALAAHEGQWRDIWIMVIPWGATLAALYHPSISLLVLLAACFGQLLVATDTVRLLHTAAGPAMALAAAGNIPDRWLWVAVVFSVFWIRTPQFI